MEEASPSSGALRRARRSVHADPESSFFLVSPLVLLGALGTLVSTVTIVPHLVHALRTREPGGSPLAWVMGATGSTIWLVYGIASHDLLVGAPGLVTIPSGVLLAVWSLRGAAGRPTAASSSALASAPEDAVYVPDEWLAGDHATGDTREMPAVA